MQHSTRGRGTCEPAGVDAAKGHAHVASTTATYVSRVSAVMVLGIVPFNWLLFQYSTLFNATHTTNWMNRHKAVTHGWRYQPNTAPSTYLSWVIADMVLGMVPDSWL